MEDACDIDVCEQVTEYKSYIQVLLRMILKNVDTISANTEKQKTSTNALKAGDKVLVSLTVDSDDKDIRVGFYMSNGYVRYISASGNIYHTFTIYEDDNYRFFIQNKNSIAVDIDGYYSIQ